MRAVIRLDAWSIRATRLWTGSLAQTVSPVLEFPTTASPPGVIPRTVSRVVCNDMSICRTVLLSLLPAQIENPPPSVARVVCSSSPMRSGPIRIVVHVGPGP